MTTSLARCGCRGRIFVEKESATQIQVEDHQRGFCDGDKVSMLRLRLDLCVHRRLDLRLVVLSFVLIFIVIFV